MAETLQPVLQFKEDLAVVEMLKPQMLVFIGEIVAGAKPQDAAERAGYAPSAGYRLMKLPEVLEAILAERQRQLKRLEVSEENVLRQLARIAFVDKRDFFNADGSPKNIQELSLEAAACVSSIDVQEIWGGSRGQREVVGRVLKYRFEDVKGANELLGRYLKLWTDKLEVSGPEALIERLRKARQNVGKELPELNAEPAPSRE